MSSSLDSLGKTPPQIFAEVSETMNADILYINSSIERGLDTIIIDVITRQRIKDNVILVLVTSGGDADAAFKITRALQRFYKRSSVH